MRGRMLHTGRYVNRCLREYHEDVKWRAWAMDGDARRGTALPWVGAAGSRPEHKEAQNTSGGDLYDSLK